ncbi:hypothetical protein pb186bvf_003641 [Paramecium bursaria]
MEFNLYLFFQENPSIYKGMQLFNVLLAFIIIFQRLLFAPYAIKLEDSQNTQQGQFVRYLLQILQLIVFLYADGFQLSQLIQCTCTMMICLTYYIDIVYWKARDNKNLIITQFFTNSIGFSLCCIQLSSVRQYTLYKYGILWIIMTPLLTYLQVVYSHQESNIFQVLQLKKINSFQQLRYVSTKLVYFKEHNDDQTQMLISSLHIQNCKRRRCNSSKNQYNNVIKHLINNTQEQYYEYLSKDRQKTNIEEITLIYIQYLIESEQLSQVYLLLNQLNQKKQKNNLIIQREKLKNDQPSSQLNEEYKTTYKILSILQQNHLSFIFTIYIQIYFLITKEIIKRKTESQGLDLSFKKSVQRFIENENNRHQLNRQFQDIIELKIKFLVDICSKSSLEKNLVDQILKLNQKMNNFYLVLINRYRQNQSYRNQNVLLIFQLEVITDYIGAYRVNEESTFDLEGLQNQFELYIQNSINSKYYYLSVTLIDCSRIIINKYSKNLRQLYTQKLSNVNELLPNLIKQYHPKFVKQFLQYGKNKFQDQFNNAFLQLENQTIYPIQLSITRDQSEQNQLQFALMIQPVQNIQNFMFVDSNQIIQEVSESFCSLQAQQIVKFLYQQKLSNVIENCQKYISKQEVLHYDVNFHIILNDHKQETIDSNYYQQYVCQLYINKQQLNKQDYFYILYFEQIKKISSDKSLSTNIKKSELINDFNESVRLDYPLSDNEVYQEYNNQEYFAEQIQPNQTVDNLLNNHEIIVSSRTNNANLVQNNQIDVQFEGSQMSSIGGLRKSQFYKKFAMIDTLIRNKTQSKNVQVSYYIMNLFLFICFVYCIIFITTIMTISQLSSDISLITIKNDIFEPFQSFIVFRYTIVNYNNLIFLNLITASQYSQLIAFPQSNLAQAYDNSKLSIQSVLERKEFQSFLIGNYLTVMMYQRTGVGKQTNLTFRSVLSQFLNYQYDFKLAYTIKPLDRDSPYFYYSYINYLDIYDKIDNLGNYIQELTTNRAINQIDQSLFRMLIFTFIQLILFSQILYHNKKYNDEHNQYFQLVKQLDLQHVTFEIKRLKELLDQINQDEDYLQQTKVIMQDKEQNLVRIQKQFSSQQQESNIIVKTKLFFGYFVYTFMFLLTIILILTGELIYKSYLNKYQYTVHSFKYLSDVGVNIPTMYAQRETLYYRSVFFFTLSQQYQDSIYSQIDKCIKSLEIFNQYFNKLNWPQTIYDQQTQNYIMDVIQNNLCNYLDSNFTIKAKNICNITMQGTLQKGLGATVVEMYQSIQTDLQQTNFSLRTTFPLLELEGASLTSNVIVNINKIIKQGIQLYNQNIQNQYYLILTLFILLVFFYSMAIYSYQEWERRRFCNLKKIIYVFPQSSLLYDDALHRNIQSLTINF